MVSWYAHFKDGGNAEDAGVKPTRDSRALRLFHRGRLALAGRPALLRAYTGAWARIFRVLDPGGAEEVSLRLRTRHQEAVGLDEFLMLGLIGVAYGAAQLAATYGFLAVAGLAWTTRIAIAAIFAEFPSTQSPKVIWATRLCLDCDIGKTRRDLSLDFQASRIDGHDLLLRPALSLVGER